MVGWILVAMVGARSAAMGFNRLVDRADRRGEPAHGVAGVAGRTGDAAVRGAVRRRFGGAADARRLAAEPALSDASRRSRSSVLLGYSYTKRFTGARPPRARPGARRRAARGLDRGARRAGADAVRARGGGAHSGSPASTCSTPCRTSTSTGAPGSSRSRRGSGWSARSASRRCCTSRRSRCSPRCRPSIPPGSARPTGSGVAGCALLLAYQHAIVRPGDLSRLNAAFFTANGLLSVGLFLATAVDLLGRG